MGNPAGVRRTQRLKRRKKEGKRLAVKAASAATKPAPSK
jgi:hypothetical protein